MPASTPTVRAFDPTGWAVLYVCRCISSLSNRYPTRAEAEALKRRLESNPAYSRVRLVPCWD